MRNPVRFAGGVGTILLTAVLIGIGIPVASFADARHDVYTVTGVPVDATSTTAQRAKDLAIASGELRAARQLLERLTLRRDQPRLPQVSASDVPGLVEGFEVANERTSAVRYLADLTVVFKPDAVRALIQGAGIPVADTPSKPVLVLPVWRTGQTAQLFDDRNPWRAAWLRIASGKGLVPLLTPLGDVTDLAAINAEQALSGDPKALAAIAAKYSVGTVVVAIASGDDNGDSVSQVSAIRYSIGGGPRTTYAVSPRKPPEALLATAVAVQQEIEEAWKAANVVDTGSMVEQTLQTDVPVSQLAEWISIRQRLGQVSLVKKVDVNSLGVGNATVTLHYDGTIDQLQAALTQADLLLSQQDGAYTLRSRTPMAASAPAAQAPSAPAPSGPAPSATMPPASAPRQ